jgi:hypothetical protein
MIKVSMRVFTPVFALLFLLSPFILEKQGMGQVIPGVVEFLQPELYDRVLAVSDIHGMYPQLLALLKAAGLVRVESEKVLWNENKTLLLVLGDSVDKGPESVEVIDLWISLQAQAESTQGRIVHLMGNHEAEFLVDPFNKKTRAFQAELKKKKIDVQQFFNPLYARARFLRSMPLAARVGVWMFSHSGFYPELAWKDFKAKANRLLSAGSFSDALFIGFDSILKAKKWERNPNLRSLLESRLTANGYVGAVFGHQPGALKIPGESGISHDGRLIKIDNGMAPQAGSHAGSVLSFLNPIELKATKLEDLHKINVTTILPSGETRKLAVEREVDH